MPRILNSSSPAPKSRNSEAAAGSYHISRILLCYRTLRHSQAFLGISVSRAGAQYGWLNRNVFSQRGYTATLSEGSRGRCSLPLPSFWSYWPSLASLGLEPHHSNICTCAHLASILMSPFSVSEVPSSFKVIRLGLILKQCDPILT